MTDRRPAARSEHLRLRSSGSHRPKPHGSAAAASTAAPLAHKARTWSARRTLSGLLAGGKVVRPTVLREPSPLVRRARVDAEEITDDDRGQFRHRLDHGSVPRAQARQAVPHQTRVRPPSADRATDRSARPEVVRSVSRQLLQHRDARRVPDLLLYEPAQFGRQHDRRVGRRCCGAASRLCGRRPGRASRPRPHPRPRQSGPRTCFRRPWGKDAHDTVGDRPTS